ncbi:MAG: excinuclease ABC subunit C [Deltaproteobacteria bacterium 13_1_20CM_2_69_21]|nr:MAG: excinuclease ABC subunit C [Deltaproteobacteria bacterium 13_1_40CM_4_68_19]OLD48034.1 MAG: excinuclease ABC subunit C [Chloroflexi bacterium 13_1_40CM_2_68_14]OLE62998.1 MAG: excinuclease ABC subunit C [Deltaproteobacteria bacterium 13_1_20CM_2_69_21]
MLSAELKQKLETLPTQAGCYVMKDKAGDVVYVGKAVNLRARVGQYFQERSSDTRAFIPFLEDLLSDVEVMITPSEKDAVLLENELIKKYRPRFNVKLRDDKNFISLRLSNTHPYPRLEVVRRVRKDGARYFGPFASASSIRETLSIVNRHFQLRTCTDSVMANRRRPCLQYQIKRCPAPCVYNVPQEEYRRSVEEVALFLEGKADELTGQLQTRMKDASGKLEYERAAQLRDQLHAIERSLEKQRTVLGELLDQDVLGFHREGPALEIHLLFFRNGRLTGGRSFGFSKQEFPTEELLSSFLDQYYESGALIPKELLLPMHLPDAEMREVWLSEKKGEWVRVHVPERGEKVRLVEMAMENARQSYEEKARSQKSQLEALTRLQSRLRLPRLPRRIECFDISTFQGQLTVGSQVVFSDGEPDKSGYRLFKVRGDAAGDDFASMFQVLTRRLKRGIEEQNLPDLLVVDGGKGQLNVARAALKEVGLTLQGVPLAGLAKSRVLEDEERFAARQGFRVAEAWAEKAGPEPVVPQIAGEAGTAPSAPPEPPSRRGRSRQKGRFVKGDIERSPERVFLPGQKNPVVLRQNTSELHLLARLRDEAHRFAITFHRKLRRERNFRSVLEEIPGIGDKRKRALLAHFGSLKRIRAATVEEIAQVEGFNLQLAERVQRFLAAQSAEVEAREAAEGGAALDGGAPPEAGPDDGTLLRDREDVAFDAAAAELDALEEEEAPAPEPIDAEPPPAQ